MDPGRGPCMLVVFESFRVSPGPRPFQLLRDLVAVSEPRLEWDESDVPPLPTRDPAGSRRPSGAEPASEPPGPRFMSS